MGAGRNSGTADKLAELHERIVEGVETLAGSEQWRAWLAVAARFPRYSLNNTLAIMLQAPQASLVCGFRRWQGMGRQVCKGERGLAILAPCAYKVSPTADGEQGAGREPGQPGPDGAEPRRQLRGFKVAYVFDVSQTDGEPLPEPAAPQLLTGQAPAGLWDALAEQVAAHGYALERGDCGTANGWANGATRTVRVRGDVDDAQACKTLAHELAHIECGHTDQGALYDRPLGEMVAESVACLVTSARGLVSDAYTIPYVASWSTGDPQRVRNTATTVLAAARSILDRLDAPAGHAVSPVPTAG